MTTDKIVFDGKRPEWGMFSNYSMHSFKIDGKTFMTAEHYIQSQKFVYIGDLELQKKIMETIRWSSSIHELKEKVRMYIRDYGFDSELWDERRPAVIKRAIEAKFEQNSYLKKILINTGELKLVDKTYKDTKMNKLTSEILTELREAFTS